MERNIEQIIEQVNRLMAIANDEAASDNESDMAYERAQRLINRYRLENWKRDHIDEPIIERDVEAAKDALRHSQADLAAAVAEANGCRIYLKRETRGGRITDFHITFVGTKSDVDTAVLLYESMELNCANRYRAAYRKAVNQRAALLSLMPDRTTGQAYEEARKDIPRRRFRNGFHAGFSNRISERFDALTKDMESTGKGRELVLSRTGRLDDYFGKLGLGHGKRASYDIDPDALGAGYEAGGMVGLGLSETEATPDRAALAA